MKQSSFIPAKTADGSFTLYSSAMEESYHSMNGAVQESKHVFIEAGLHQFSQKQLSIFEVGFGTGLNALLSWGEAQRRKLQIEYDAIEAYPVAAEVLHVLNYKKLEPELPPSAFLQIHLGEWNTPLNLEKGTFVLKKILGDFATYKFTKKYDLIYFDAFAPEKQPEMWDESLFRRLYSAMNQRGIIVTYCAKGEVRRRMERSGFNVTRIQGPAGKREMIRAFKK